MPANYLELDENPETLVKCNITSVNTMTSLVLPGMVKRKAGAVINLSSLSGLMTTPMYSVYSGTKAYVDAFTRGLAVEYAPLNIVAQSVAPGYVTTKMSKIRKPTLLAC